MEILGAVASSVALGQALGGGRHIARLVHEIPDIQHDFNELRQDISLITAMLNDVHSGITTWGSSSVSGRAGEMLLERTAQRLEEINSELQRFLEHCGKESADSNAVKAKKRKWVLQSDKLQKLREKSMDAKMNLHFALTSQSRGLVCEQVNALQHQFEMFTLHMSSRRPSDSSLRISSSDFSDEEKTEGPESEVVESASSLDSSTEAQLTRRDESRSSTYATTNQWQQITPMRRVRCSKLCRCRCHSSQGRSRRANWTIPFLGSLLVDYQSTPGTQQTACSDIHCSATTESVLELNYYSPPWLWNGVVSFGASYHNAAGLQVALRPKRVLSRTDQVIAVIDSPFENFCDAIRTGTIRIYPDDEVAVQLTVIEFLILFRRFDYVEFLLNLWRELLPGQSFPRSLVGHIKDVLSTHQDLTGQLKSLLGQVLSSADETLDETRVCQAIKQGLDISFIRQALEDEPWTVNVCDIFGNPPLHLALYQLRDPMEALELLIAMGADVHLRGLWGRTPLMIAAEKGNLECILILPRAKRALAAKDWLGNTALHRATMLTQFEAVQLLLASGSQVAAQNVDGDMPLHFLGATQIEDEQVAQKILRLLLKHQEADIEARNYLGQTPVVMAAITNRIPAIRLLVNEGASLQAVDNGGFTLLHYAASLFNLQTLQYLDRLNLSGIDLNHLDNVGRTPWDVFQIVISVSPVHLGSCRRPFIAEQQAFVSLYEGIRNRTAEQDISQLEQVLHALSHQETTTVFSLLQALIEEKQKWASGLDKWYRILARQVKEGESDAVVESVVDYIAELRELIQSSAWNLPSIYTPRLETGEDQDLDTDYESSEEDVHSDDDSDGEEYESSEGEVGSDGELDEEDQNRQP